MNGYQQMVEAADAVGLRLEMVGGLSVWEASPIIRHQKAIDRIRAAIRPRIGSDSCGCVHYADIQVLFPDGSHKRPDIAIFCREPDEEETEVTLLPEAVIEVLSKGYEDKDLEIGVPFYRRMGVRDIIVLDPGTNAVTHHRLGEPVRDLVSPVGIELACGCVCTV